MTAMSRRIPIAMLLRTWPVRLHPILHAMSKNSDTIEATTRLIPVVQSLFPPGPERDRCDREVHGRIRQLFGIPCLFLRFTLLILIIHSTV